MHIESICNTVKTTTNQPQGGLTTVDHISLHNSHHCIIKAPSFFHTSKLGENKFLHTSCILFLHIRDGTYHIFCYLSLKRISADMESEHPKSEGTCHILQSLARITLSFTCYVICGITLQPPDCEQKKVHCVKETRWV
jgi:hypothetical protein